MPGTGQHPIQCPPKPARLTAGIGSGHPAEAAFAGVNLCVSGRAPDEGTRYFRRAALLPHGDLLVLFQGWNLVQLDEPLDWLDGTND